MHELEQQLEAAAEGNPWKKLMLMDPHAEFPGPLSALYGEQPWNDAVAQLATRPQRQPTAGSQDR